MGGYAKFCIESMFGWLKTIVQQIWTISYDPGSSNPLSWIGENWKWVLLAVCFAGAIADLLVYLFRWEPIKVWKSYLKRRRNRYHPNRSAKFRENEFGGYPYPDTEAERISAAGGEPMNTEEEMPEPELPEQPEYLYPEEPRNRMPGTPVFSAPNTPTPPEYQAMYRRPQQTAQNGMNEADYSFPGSVTERNLEKVIRPRRKKIRINELFRDSEDKAGIYDAPQPVIDQNEAYHAPVFPRNWKDNGEDPT